MLTRQKILLALLQCGRRPLGRTRFAKLAFLLRHETSVGKESTFYDFLPYKYGPFSFALYREMEALQRKGHVRWEENRVALRRGASATTRAALHSLPQTARRAAAAIVRQYAGSAEEAFLRDVYARYPWYATRSELRGLRPPRLPRIQVAHPDVYTVGYEGKSVDAFFDLLLKKGIARIVDVRANPISRKYGFARKSMSDIAGKLGIEYLHRPEVGIPSHHRSDLDDYASYQRLFESYEREVLADQETVGRIVEIMRARPSVLVCMERDARWCHRGRLAAAVSRESGMQAVHL